MRTTDLNRIAMGQDVRKKRLNIEIIQYLNLLHQSCCGTTTKMHKYFLMHFQDLPFKQQKIDCQPTETKRIVTRINSTTRPTVKMVGIFLPNSFPLKKKVLLDRNQKRDRQIDRQRETPTHQQRCQLQFIVVVVVMSYLENVSCNPGLALEALAAHVAGEQAYGTR